MPFVVLMIADDPSCDHVSFLPSAAKPFRTMLQPAGAEHSPQTDHDRLGGVVA
jgi:hypothetical protein